MKDIRKPLPEGPIRFDNPAPSPCGNCPYRLDAPRRLWAPEEFVRLVQADRDPLGGIYACHKRDGQVCGGWLFDQRRRDFPSIMLRLRMSNEPSIVPHAVAAHDGGNACFASIEAMCRANGVPIADPPPDPYLVRLERRRAKRRGVK